MNFSQHYNPAESEHKWQNHWHNLGTYSWDKTIARQDSFVIDTPPPTVSGLLHMGHIFSYTQADFIARYQRMKGKNVFYPIGFDDNGLPTERLVEKVKNIRAVHMPRAEFINICTEVVAEAEEEFRTLFKSIALSVDWGLEYQTISPKSRAISQMSFLDLLEKNYAYRMPQPTLWDPIDQTALAQADIVDQELSSAMNDIAFTTDTGHEIIIATTRPELIPACVAVFYHPDDKRYQHLSGKKAITPLFQAHVPILADETVDMEKGTGLVMCCTFGDITDVHWWKTHKLETKIILGKNGRISDLVGPYATELNGLKVKEARIKVLALLQEHNLLKKQTEITHSVKCAERSGSPLEILVTPQWFIKILDIKEQLLEKAAECNWHPEYMKVRLDNWIHGLSWDWCISRQRFFGVPFPIWYSKRAGEEGKVLYAAKEDLPVDPMVDLPRGYSKDEVEPDMDVMDTWATSSVSPQLSSWGINSNYALDYERHQSLFPADLRPQAHEIIRTWAFYTLVKAQLHEQTIPWHNLMISGWCLAADKTKMSKSKGNVITPVSLIHEKGADSVRYWASTSRLGADIAYSEEVFKIGKKLVTKLWNAAKFASLHLAKLTTTPGTAISQIKSGIITAPLDLWILERLKITIEKASEEFEKFEYCGARCAIEDFFWNDFCDNYLEIVKVRAYDESGQDALGQQSAINTIYHCLEALLRLLAPFLPHVTEELYQMLFESKLGTEKSIHHKGFWPNATDYIDNGNYQAAGVACISILNVVRKFKAEHNLSLKVTINDLHIVPTRAEDIPIVAAILSDLKHVTNANQATTGTKLLEGKQYITSEDGQYQLYASL